MPRSGDGFLSEDHNLDAAQDAAYERFLQAAVACAECETLYEPGYHPATRHEPGWVEQEECPHCGSTAIKA